MPDKNPAADRWGGPGSSDENAKQGRPDPTVKDRDDPDHGNRHSQVSSGGGEADVHHDRNAHDKRDVQAGDAEKKQH